METSQRSLARKEIRASEVFQVTRALLDPAVSPVQKVTRETLVTMVKMGVLETLASLVLWALWVFPDRLVPLDLKVTRETKAKRVIRELRGTLVLRASSR
jgi:hypothetical protein